MILKCSSQIKDKITVWSIINMIRTANEKKNIPEGMVLIPEGLFLMGSTKQDIGQQKGVPPIKTADRSAKQDGGRAQY